MKEKLIKNKEELDKAIEQGTAQLNFMLGRKAQIEDLLKDFEDGKEEEKENVLKPE